MKPRIIYKDGNWVCHDNYETCGHGMTPSQAYTLWATKRTTFTRVPRRFKWNLRDCMNWFRRGCPRTCYYFAYPDGMKQVFGYDPKTDELILRG